MRRIIPFLAILVLLAGGFFLLEKGKTKTSEPFFPVVEKKSFVIIIPTFNDAKLIQGTLFSVFEQTYDHFRVVLVDDQSSDQTVSKAVDVARFFKLEEKVHILKNQSHCGTLGSIYNGTNTCHDHEIAFILLGGDRLSSPDALEKLNHAYANPEVWMTYGNAIEFPSYTSFEQQRTNDSISLPLSFYGALFKEIPITSLFYRGRFYEMGWEYAVGIPLLEMAKEHALAITETLYLAHQKSNHREHLLHPAFFKECVDHVKKRPLLPPLSHLPSHSFKSPEQADLLIFSKDRPLHLHALLESVESHVLGIHQITVYYESSTHPFETGYQELAKLFPSVCFLKKTTPFKTQFMNTGFAPSYSSSAYVLLATDGVLIQNLIDMSQATEALKLTHAYGVYFDLHEKLHYCSHLNRYQPIPVTTPLSLGSFDINAWQLSWASDDWSQPGSLNFALFRKGDLGPLFSEIEFETSEELLREWNFLHKDAAIGLFYPQANSLRIKTHENATGDLEKFLGGLKLDLSSFVQITSPAREISMEVAYSPRE